MMTQQAAPGPLVSVIVPTFDRLDTLPEVLDALEVQQGAPEFEVLVVDDGSADGTADFLSRRAKVSARASTEGGPVSVRFFRQENRGPAAARNRGLSEARGRLVAFLGDDTVPSKGWLAAHLAAHQRPVAESAREQGQVVGSIGYTGWHPRTKSTRFLEYINEHGLQFGYALIDDPDQVPFNFFYTSNLLLDREVLLEEQFDLDFPYPAWEDIELSYRLHKKFGLRLLYAADAIVAHDHPTNLQRFYRRQEKAGFCAVVFYQRHPELGGFLGLSEQGPPPLPSRARQAFLQVLAQSLQLFNAGWPKLWEEVLRFHYIRGLRRGWRTRLPESSQ